MTTANHPVTPAMTPVSLPSYSLKNPPGYVSLPNYSLTTLPPGIVHIGPGGFFLAHFASYMHDYMQMTKDTSWGITVASLRSPGTITGLRKQDHRYVLVEREDDK